MIDIKEHQFDDAVIAASRAQLVLVDFWAPWCAPCRVLGPVLEQVEAELGGTLKLVKINSDDNPALSARFKVRGIPFVLLFRDGQPIDQFVGARTAHQVKAFLQPHLPRPEDGFISQARAARDQGDRTGAAEALSTAVALNPANDSARRDYVRVLLDLGRRDDARAAFEPLRAAAAFEPATGALAFLIEAADSVAAGPDLAARRAQMSEQADSAALRFGLAQALALQSQWQEAMDQLLEVIRIERKFRDDAARKAMIAIFELCGDAALVSSYRRKLSASLY
jgi:putative thioredoxin